MQNESLVIKCKTKPLATTCKGSTGMFFFYTIHFSQGMFVFGTLLLEFPKFPFSTNSFNLLLICLIIDFWRKLLVMMCKIFYIVFFSEILTLLYFAHFS